MEPDVNHRLVQVDEGVEVVLERLASQPHDDKTVHQTLPLQSLRGECSLHGFQASVSEAAQQCPGWLANALSCGHALVVRLWLSRLFWAFLLRANPMLL